MKFTYASLFSGIGGFDLAANKLGGQCVFASEIKPTSRLIYRNNLGFEPSGDITKIQSSEIPTHDVLFAGFPCQSFSIYGKRGGLEDPRGKLIFEMFRVIRDKKPKMFILENVPNFAKMKKGQIIGFVVKTLESFGYRVGWNTLNSENFGLPQFRERIYIVGIRDDDRNGNLFYSWPGNSRKLTYLKDIIDRENDLDPGLLLSVKELLTAFKYEQNLYKNGETYEENNLRYYIHDAKHMPNTLIASDMRKNLIYTEKDPYQINKLSITKFLKQVYKNATNEYIIKSLSGGSAIAYGYVRYLSVRECARLQGFGDTFSFAGVKKTTAYNALGNAVSVKVVQSLIRVFIQQFFPDWLIDEKEIFNIF